MRICVVSFIICRCRSKKKRQKQLEESANYTRLQNESDDGDTTPTLVDLSASESDSYDCYDEENLEAVDTQQTITSLFEKQFVKLQKEVQSKHLRDDGDAEIDKVAVADNGDGKQVTEVAESATSVSLSPKRRLRLRPRVPASQTSQRQLEESSKRARRLQSESDDDDTPPLVNLSDSSDEDNFGSSNDDYSDEEKLEADDRQQTSTKIQKFEQKLSKLQKTAQHLHLPFPADDDNSDATTEEIDKVVVADNGDDKQQVAEEGGSRTRAAPVSQPPKCQPPPRVQTSTVKLRLRLNNKVLPRDLWLNSRWATSRRARTHGHQHLNENAFSRYMARGRSGGRKCQQVFPDQPNERERNREMNRQRVQDAAAEVLRKVVEKKNTFQQCIDTLYHAWRQPTLAGRFSCVYKPDTKEKTVCA